MTEMRLFGKAACGEYMRRHGVYGLLEASQDVANGKIQMLPEYC